MGFYQAWEQLVTRFLKVSFESFIISVIGITLGFGLSVLLNYGIINYINNSIGDLLDFKIELSIFGYL